MGIAKPDKGGKVKTTCWTEKENLSIFPLISSMGPHSGPRRRNMAHKKITRAKELDRRRKRREERLKARIHEAQAAAAKK